MMTVEGNEWFIPQISKSEWDVLKLKVNASFKVKIRVEEREVQLKRREAQLDEVMCTSFFCIGVVRRRLRLVLSTVATQY